MTKTQVELNEQMAERLFGWKWMSWRGIPAKDTPGYPRKCRVRQFLSPEELGTTRWRSRLQVYEGREADRLEVLSYAYCSSCVPSYFTTDDYLVLARVRELWPAGSPKYEVFAGHLAPAEDYRRGDYSRAVLSVLSVFADEDN